MKHNGDVGCEHEALCAQDLSLPEIGSPEHEALCAQALILLCAAAPDDGVSELDASRARRGAEKRAEARNAGSRARRGAEKRRKARKAGGAGNAGTESLKLVGRVEVDGKKITVDVGHSFEQPFMSQATIITDEQFLVKPGAEVILFSSSSTTNTE